MQIARCRAGDLSTVRADFVDGSRVPDKILSVYSGHWPPGSFSALRVLHIASVSFHPAAMDVTRENAVLPVDIGSPKCLVTKMRAV